MPPPGLNTVVGLVPKMLGVRADPYQVFNFLIEIEGIFSGGFSECSGLQVETEYMDYREGGQNDFVHRFAGPTKYPPLVLKHGLTQIDGLWVWHQEIVKGNITRQNGTIYLLDKQGIPVIWWDFKEAFPVRWTGPELRAGSNEVAFESVELAHRGLSRPGLSSLVAGIGAQLAGSIGF
ncbi:MAG TPA: phage tail protein [Blastocatellia bacterium]|nr:phage tail protein [Blastocatellia bacterium]